jgi:hypothetical protein
LFPVGGGAGGWVLADGVHGREDDLDGSDPPLFDGAGLKADQRDLFSLVPDKRGQIAAASDLSSLPVLDLPG